MSALKIGVLAFQGDVIEHIKALQEASKDLNINTELVEARTKNDLKDLGGLIIPGGESTTLYKLCQREGMWEDIKKIKKIFGTCAGAIMLAKVIRNGLEGQKTLGLMEIEVDRNAYGTQTDSFEKDIKTSLGDIQAVFIRAPKIKKVGKSVKILAKEREDILACEQSKSGKYYLASCFHPELNSTKFHEHFLKRIDD